MLLESYPRKTQSTILGPNLCFLLIGILTFAKQPHHKFIVKILKGKA
jgi:hypothetical protein